MEKNKTNNEENLKKKAKKTNGTKYIIVFVFVLAVILILGFWYLNNSTNISGTYLREISLNDVVEDNIEKYLLETSYADDINPGDYLDGLTITSVLTIDNEGNFSEEIDKDTVTICKDNAKKSLEEIVKTVIENRLDMLKIENNESTEDLINETLSMSLDDYLDEYGPDLIPDDDKLNQNYGRKAKYSINKNILELKETDKVSDYEFFKSGNKLVIVYGDEAIVYHEK